MKKEFGGLGIPNPQDLNIYLIGSWIRRYINGEGSLWKKVVDAKYNTKSPNILCYYDTQPSVFLKGVMWAAGAVKFGYKWLVGDGKAIKFLEDTWYGNAPLAVIYWDIYMIVSQQAHTVYELCDGFQLKYTFRRTFTDELMIKWLEILEIAKGITSSDSPDQLI
jgi:hypothetical protein